MRHLAILASLIGASSFAADFTPWQYTQPVDVTAIGLHSIAMRPDTLNVARPALDDLRVISPTGVETPFVIEWPELQPVRLVEPARFDMSLGDGVTELRIATETTEPIRAIHLQPAAAKFLKALRVESSPDGATWQSFLTSGIIFREPNHAESTAIKLPPQSHGHLRMVIDDQNSPPIAFSEVRLELGASAPDTKPLATTLRSREELNGKTRLTLDLGGKNVFVGALQIVASDPVFSRRVAVSMPSDDGPDIRSQAIASATLFRIALGDQTSSSLEIPIHREVTGDKLIVDITNGDSPPLKIDTIETTQHPVEVLFHAGETGEWRLISGNLLAATPRYDVAAIKQQLASATANRIAPGSLTVSSIFKKPTALPEIESKATGVDLARCRFRKSVAVPAPGVISIDLDAEVLSHSQTSLGDLRLVQDGRQVPFIIDWMRPDGGSFIKPTITLATDPKQPSVSRWSVIMPVDSLPSDRLTCISTTPLFDRRISASALMGDEYGNETKRHLGSARWTHKPSDASNVFELRFDQERVPHLFTLETDNGDNPPIEIALVRIYHRSLRLVAKITNTSPVFLYYGNATAMRPQYDLRLVQSELTAAPKEKATLGTEDKLDADHAIGQPSSTGSPWLWLALAMMVGALLWVVGKMLPKSSDGQDAA